MKLFNHQNLTLLQPTLGRLLSLAILPPTPVSTKHIWDMMALAASSQLTSAHSLHSQSPELFQLFHHSVSSCSAKGICQ